MQEDKKRKYSLIKRKEINMKTIYLAGGCFWGVEAFFKKKDFTRDTEVGYANSIEEDPSYKRVCTGMTKAAETLRLDFEGDLRNVLDEYFKIIDPTVMNRQGPDHGSQYRTGIYYLDDEDRQIILDYIESVKKNYRAEIVTEVRKLENFYPAEEYHQDYLDKNPGGYCHIDLNL